MSGYGRAKVEKKIKVLQILSGLKKPKCSKCGETNIFVLGVNHLKGNGRKELEKTKYFKFVDNVIDGTRNKDDLEVRCMNCNILYEYERGQRHLPENWEDIVEELI